MLVNFLPLITILIVLTVAGQRVEWNLEEAVIQYYSN